MNRIAPPPRLRIRSASRLQDLPAERPTILGVTGGIACGKSLITEMFRRKGAAVVSADQLARQAVEPGTPALAALVEQFGPVILTPEGSLDRQRMAQQVFSDPSARRVLERIVHPAIRQLAEERLQTLAASAEIPLIVYEAPLLFEAQAESRVDLILVVSLDDATQFRRLQRRDSLSDEETLTRIRVQMPLGEKIARADLVLDNSGSPEDAERAVSYLYQILASQDKKSPR